MTPAELVQRALHERTTQKKPTVGDVVAVFIDGTAATARSGKIVAISGDRWTIDVELKARPDAPAALLTGCTFAPAAALREGKARPAHSWDFIV